MATTTALKRLLSESVDGQPIKVVATSSSGTLIHTATSGTTPGNYDKIWLYAYNGDTVTRLLTIQFGGTASPDNDVKVNIAAQSGTMLIIPGWPLQNSKEVRAYASAANVITIAGEVDRTADG